MIRLNDIVVKFGDFTALHSINVHVKEGEFFTFLGPSGCGKTTTLRTITGFIEPAEGSVVVKGRDITRVPIEDRNIGIVFQSYALFPTMTVYDNIAFGLRVKKAKKDEIDRKVREIARKVDLSDEQLKKAWDMDREYMQWWFNYLYDRYDEMRLLLVFSDGTKYANFEHEWVEGMSHTTYAYYKEAQKRGLTKTVISEEELHVMLSSFWTAICEPLIHGFTKEEAGRISDLMCGLFDWYKMLGFER